jgi:hypothetical protein
MRERSSGPGAKLTVELPAPSSQHSTKGIVKIPTRFVPTVSNSASAALPPTACEHVHTILFAASQMASSAPGFLAGRSTMLQACKTIDA